MAENGEGRTFKHYLELPAEVRKVINDEMDPDDMCRFTRCSRLCLKEVKRSNKYIYGLTFDSLSEQNLTVTVVHARSYHQHCYEYRVVFRAVSNQKFLKYSIPAGSSWRELWKVELDNSIDLVHLASDYFKNLLESHQNSIKLLRIERRWIYDVEVRSLNNLRSLDLSSCVGNIIEVISRRQTPLEYFAYSGEMSERFLEVGEFMCRVQDLYIPRLNLNMDQFRRLSARNFRIHIGELTPNDIFTFITSWKNGELREDFHRGCWFLRGYGFEVQDLWKLLRVTPQRGSRQDFVIEHNKEAGSYADLSYFDYEDEKLIFSAYYV